MLTVIDESGGKRDKRGALIDRARGSLITSLAVLSQPFRQIH